MGIVKTNPCSKNWEANNIIYEESVNPDGFNYEHFYNGINYVSPGIHLNAHGYYKECLKYAQSGDKWLDVGCGSGLNFSQSIKVGIEAYGIDIVDKSIEIANTRGIKAIKCSACEKYPFPDKYFDFITATDVLEHLLENDVSKALNEIYRVQKDGGYLLLASCPGNSCNNKPVKNWKQHLHLTLKSKNEWLKMYEKHGFALVEESVCHAFILKKV